MRHRRKKPRLPDCVSLVCKQGWGTAADAARTSTEAATLPVCGATEEQVFTWGERWVVPSKRLVVRLTQLWGGWTFDIERINCKLRDLFCPFFLLFPYVLRDSSCTDESHRTWQPGLLQSCSPAMFTLCAGVSWPVTRLPLTLLTHVKPRHQQFFLRCCCSCRVSKKKKEKKKHHFWILPSCVEISLLSFMQIEDSNYRPMSVCTCLCVKMYY